MKRYKPFIVTLLVILADQLTKALVVMGIEENTMWKSFFGDFLRIIHVRNNAVAFSMGSSLPLFIKIVLFIIVPMVFLGFLAHFLIKDEKELSKLQRYLVAGIIGGGVGNLIDRIFRGMSVVDFISTNNYGWFGMERFPTYNLADASVVICVILMILSFIFEKKEEK